MARKATDLVWLGAIAALVAGGTLLAQRAPEAAPLPVGTLIPHKMGQRFSIRGVRIGMSTKQAFSTLLCERVNELGYYQKRCMKRLMSERQFRLYVSDTHWIPDYDLDGNSHISRVSGCDAQDNGVQIIRQGKPLPTNLATFGHGAVRTVVDGPVRLTIRLDANHNVLTTTLTGNKPTVCGPFRP